MPRSRVGGAVFPGRGRALSAAAAPRRPPAPAPNKPLPAKGWGAESALPHNAKRQKRDALSGTEPWTAVLRTPERARRRSLDFRARPGEISRERLVVPAPGFRTPAVRGFAHMHARGATLTSGAKFGAEYLAYPGDPAAYHASFTVRVMDGDGRRLKKKTTTTTTRAPSRSCRSSRRRACPTARAKHCVLAGARRVGHVPSKLEEVEADGVPVGEARRFPASRPPRVGGVVRHRHPGRRAEQPAPPPRRRLRMRRVLSVTRRFALRTAVNFFGWMERTAPEPPSSRHVPVAGQAMGLFFFLLAIPLRARSPSRFGGFFSFLVRLKLSVTRPAPAVRACGSSSGSYAARASTFPRRRLSVPASPARRRRRARGLFRPRASPSAPSPRDAASPPPPSPAARESQPSRRRHARVQVARPLQASADTDGFASTRFT